jgi:membrane protein implicated in regulation of membrane protease activity
MPWWGWIIFGAFLLAAELLGVDAAFFLVFIGLAAIVTGFMELVGIGLPEWGQWILFASLAAVSMVLFRRKLYDRLRGSPGSYHIGPVGEIIKIEDTLPPGEKSRMHYQGTTWNVVNMGSATLEKGENVRIVAVDGLTFKVNQTKPTEST